MEDLGAISTDSNKQFQLYLEGRKIKVLRSPGWTLEGEIDVDSPAGEVILGLGAPAHATECHSCGDISKEMYCGYCVDDM